MAEAPSLKAKSSSHEHKTEHHQAKTQAFLVHFIYFMNLFFIFRSFTHVAFFLLALLIRQVLNITKFNLFMTAYLFICTFIFLYLYLFSLFFLNFVRKIFMVLLVFVFPTDASKHV